jgi:hypothetical protein
MGSGGCIFKRYSQTLVFPDAEPPATPTMIGFIFKLIFSNGTL